MHIHPPGITFLVQTLDASQRAQRFHGAEPHNDNAAIARMLRVALQGLGISEPRVDEIMLQDGRPPYVRIQHRDDAERDTILSLLTPIPNYPPRLVMPDADLPNKGEEFDHFSHQVNTHVLGACHQALLSPVTEEGYRYNGYDVGLLRRAYPKPESKPESFLPAKPRFGTYA